MRPLAILVAAAACACATAPAPKPRPPIVPGEVIVRTRDESLLTTTRLAAASGRTDFAVKGVTCRGITCLVVVRRTGAPADQAWTYELIDAISAGGMPGIETVGPNLIMEAR